MTAALNRYRHDVVADRAALRRAARQPEPETFDFIPSSDVVKDALWPNFADGKSENVVSMRFVWLTRSPMRQK